MSDRTYSDHDHPLPPPEPPKLMRLTITGAGEPMRSFIDVTGSSLVGPSVFRVETSDGKIMLFAMKGRDFLLVPQGVDDV